MQLVSRKVLFDVMAHKRDITFANSNQISINETESNIEYAFKTFMDNANIFLQKSIHAYGRENGMQEYFQLIYDFMAKNKKNIRFVGKGSSRIVYALANGTALKVAWNEIGLAQNKQEIKNCMDPDMKYEIFPDFYDADTKDGLALNCELCSKATLVDFARIFQISLQPMIDVIKLIVKAKLSTENKMLHDLIRHYMSIDQNIKANFVQKLIDNKTEATKAIWSLLRFYETHSSDEMLLEDLEAIQNWGLTVRNNEKTLIVIDAGFSEQIYQDHYRHRKNSNSYEL